MTAIMFIIIEILRRVSGHALSPSVSVFAIKYLALSLPPFPCRFCCRVKFLCGSRFSRRCLLEALF